MSDSLIPLKLDPGSPENPSDRTRMTIVWSDGTTYSLPYLELRYQCPCASCVDEHTGRRILRRETLDPGVRVVGAQLVGRYGIHLRWSDGHSTGMVHFERLHELCLRYGLKAAPSAGSLR
jgi:DUF971 family protein